MATAAATTVRAPWGPDHPAAIILRQLGGGQFLAMTGAANMVYGETSLMFSIGGNPRRVWKVAVELDRGTDLYELRFWARSGLGGRLVGESLDVHAEDLRRVFTMQTGLDCTL